MQWNWQHVHWPRFSYQEAPLRELEALFFKQTGFALGLKAHVSPSDQEALMIDFLRNEACTTSEIEGEILDRASVQSSIQRHFGLKHSSKSVAPAEQGIADLMVDLYRTFRNRLTHRQLGAWYRMLTQGRRDLTRIGSYRTHPEEMRIVSGPDYKPKVHFVAPPSERMRPEMARFLQWFNDSAPRGKHPLPALTRAGIAHLYFVSIHPFEDGNGRIARALAEKVLLQAADEALLLAISPTIQKRRKAYYASLERNSKTLEIDDWLMNFAQTILTAQREAEARVDFLIQKTKCYEKIRGKLNARQEKVVQRLFRAGPDGFEGGLSAENYLKIAKTSRATATRDLQDLLEKGVLESRGTLRYTRYHLKISR